MSVAPAGLNAPTAVAVTAPLSICARLYLHAAILGQRPRQIERRFTVEKLPQRWRREAGKLAIASGLDHPPGVRQPVLCPTRW